MRISIKAIKLVRNVNLKGQVSSFVFQYLFAIQPLQSN